MRTEQKDPAVMVEDRARILLSSLRASLRMNGSTMPAIRQWAMGEGRLPDWKLEDHDLYQALFRLERVLGREEATPSPPPSP